MLRRKVIKAARVQKLAWFKSQEEFEGHIKFLKSRHREYRVDNVESGPDGSVTVLISEQYNGNVLLK